MNTQKNNDTRMWTLAALCLAALSLTAGTGCDPQATDAQTALGAAMNPSAAMARFVSPSLGTRLGWCEMPVIDNRLEKAESYGTARLASPVIESRLETAESAGIILLR